MIKRFLIISLLIYSIFSTYIITGYERINDQLQQINTTLLNSCTSSELSDIETSRYK